MAASPNPDPFGYEWSAAPFEPIDLVPGAPGVFTILDDFYKRSMPVDLGANTFSFYATTYTGTQAWVSTQGIIEFPGPTVETLNTDMTRRPVAATVAPLWTHWQTNLDANDAILGRFDDTTGDGAADRLVVEWNQVRRREGAPPGTFQAILQLNTGSAAGDITFQYIAMGSSSDLGGNYSTTGIKDLGSPTERRLVVQYNEPGNPFVAPGQAIRIRRASEPALVVARHVFYNNSVFDGRRAAADAGDDAAIDATIVAGLPGGPMVRDHFTSYSRGINGLMLDVAGLPGGAGPRADDFEFRLSNLPTPNPWTPVTFTPDVAVRRGAGADGSDRVTVVLPDGAVRNTWLEVKLLANERTGLSTPELCYFGNLVGDLVPTSDPSSYRSRVDALDLREVRAARGRPAAPATITTRTDINRDGRVNLFDEALVRANQLRTLYHTSAPLPEAISASTGRLLARRRAADHLLSCER